MKPEDFFCMDVHKVFLFGGNDLEMDEIRKIIKGDYNDIYKISEMLTGNLILKDKNLSWGAKLSSYQDLIREYEKEENTTIYGIELFGDIAPPSNYVRIDHHNDLANLPSAIEQIAEVLCIAELSRYHELVAANDKGYIPAMESLCATKSEINEIRSKDRKCQGVTEKDEELGEKSIKENLDVQHGVTVVKALTSRFSTITDRLYPCNKLIIYTDRELNYYGQNAHSLATYYSDLIESNSAYYGGAKDGYFGIVAGVFTKDEIIDLKSNILSYAKTL